MNKPNLYSVAKSIQAGVKKHMTLLENREDGVYAYCKLNSTEAGRNAKLREIFTLIHYNVVNEIWLELDQ